MDTTTFDGLTRNLGSGLTRRAALRGLVASALGAVAVGFAARVAEAGFKAPDYGSRSEFEHYCRVEGGTFSEDSLGNLICTYPGGAFHECDSNGNDCWLIPQARRNPPKGHPVNGGNNGGRVKK